VGWRTGLGRVTLTRSGLAARGGCSAACHRQQDSHQGKDVALDVGGLLDALLVRVEREREREREREQITDPSVPADSGSISCLPAEGTLEGQVAFAGRGYPCNAMDAPSCNRHEPRWCRRSNSAHYSQKRGQAIRSS
jgi:hypothetical protein